ncbi:MAG: hypothetical protein K2X71_07685 [Methylobacterium sp.]|uniref:hypothetical protein n=1 Tax=Methylobacterium sp. TaxID=409 RepID=UPI00258319F5|nr:hypothetical protein [Methylobacterium sp.]MBY0295902.1 hypothetical protein [Methylobacterium sp.]
MPRPREPFADAIRIARAIVALEGAALARARDPAAVEAAAQALACRIAEALLAAEGEATARAAASARSAIIHTGPAHS